MPVFNEDIIEIIDGAPSPSSQFPALAAPAPGFLFPCAKARYVARSSRMDSAGSSEPESFPNGGQMQARGLLDFRSSGAGKVAITGGTEDYLRALGHIVINAVGGTPVVTVHTFTIETP
jgi:hypothetical protein